jgi:hypothetical protein
LLLGQAPGDKATFFYQATKQKIIEKNKSHCRLSDLAKGGV